MKSLCLVAVLAAFGAAHGAFADNLLPFSLRLTLPSDSVDCSAHVSSLGAVFAAQTGLTVTNAACQGTDTITEDGKTYTTVNFVISYMADVEVSPVQAIFSGSEFEEQPSEGVPLFAKYSDCLAARGAQEAAYAANTGLQVFAAYCDPSGDEMSSGYSLIVEAFGTPKAQLFSFIQDDSLQPVDPQAVQAAQNVVTQGGGTVALTNATGVFYYNAYPLDIDVRDMGFFSDVSQCQAQVAAATAIFTQAQSIGPTVFCSTGSGTEAGYATLTGVAGEDTNIQEDWGDNSPKYSSFSDCMSDLSRVIQNAQSGAQNVLGGICEPSQDNDQVFVVDTYSEMN